MVRPYKNFKNLFKYICCNTNALTFMESKVGGKEGASVVNQPYPSYFLNINKQKP